jgi:hypothetical protein
MRLFSTARRHTHTANQLHTCYMPASSLPPRRAPAASRSSESYSVHATQAIHTHTHSNMSSIRPPAEEGALVRSLHEDAERVAATLDIGPWRDVADLPTVSLETCFARRRRVAVGSGATRRGEARRGERGGCSGCTRGHLGHLSLPFPADLSAVGQQHQQGGGGGDGGADGRAGQLGGGAGGGEAGGGEAGGRRVVRLSWSARPAADVAVAVAVDCRGLGTAGHGVAGKAGTNDQT